MDNVQKRITELRQEIDLAIQKLHIAEQASDMERKQIESRKPDFWNDTVAAQQTMQQISRTEAAIRPWMEIAEQASDIAELASSGDVSLSNELEASLELVSEKFATMKEQLKFSGEYDLLGAIVTLTAGAGGTDAQDWTQMLFRMYIRWAEKHGYETTVIDQSVGDEAGVKRVVIAIEGQFIYGQLRTEHGVHRLVRLSPFNADNLRQTSFAKVEVVPKIDNAESVKIDEQDIKIDVYRAGGHGGQSVNTTDSAVRVTHIPSGISVAIQNERSQLQNKAMALTILRSRLAQLQLEQHQQKIKDIKGPNQSAEWGNQIRSYVLHPYKQVKDLRTRYETSNVEAVLDGEIQPLIDAYLEQL